MESLSQIVHNYICWDIKKVKPFLQKFKYLPEADSKGLPDSYGH